MWRFIVRSDGTVFLMAISNTRMNMQLPGSKSVKIPRYLVAGAERAGNLLELVVMEIEKDVLVIHAMTLRRSTQREIFGGDDV